MDMQGRFDSISPGHQVFQFDLNDHDGYADPDMYMNHSAGNASQSSGSPYENNMAFFTECAPIPVAYPSPDVESDSSQVDGMYTTQPQGQLLPPPMVKQESDALQEGAIVGITPPTAGPLALAAPEAPTTKQPAKRKRENRYKNAPPSVLSRRRAQNRASQRAYRERKDQRIKDLEAMLAETKRHFLSLTESYNSMRLYYSRTARVTPPGVMPEEACQMGPMAGMPQTPMTQHRHSSSSAVSQMSQMSLQASPMTMPTNMSAPPVTTGMIPAFDPSAVPNMGIPPNNEHLESMYLYAHVGGGFTA